ASLLMVGNAGRMVVAMAMITSCVEPSRRGSFMSLNSAVQHFSTGLGAFVGGWIIGRASDGSLTRYNVVGVRAVAGTAVSIVLAARLRPYRPDIAAVERVRDEVAADLEGPTPGPA